MEQQGYKNYDQSNENTHIGTRYNAALYMRFSKDDGQAYDSSSIQTQKLMLEKYCADNGYRVYDSYVDDGYTGLNFDRPDFQRLLNDIDDGKVNLVITKDLSRLGRDYIQTGYYSECYFLEHNVRYIAINDGIDTLKSDNDIAPFKNILNNMYSKDLSRKIKSAIRQRVLHGLRFSGQVPYGYMKDPANKNKLIIDGEAAEVVKEIFRLALEGQGTVNIKSVMTARQIICPSTYKTFNGESRYKRFLEGEDWRKFRWTAFTVMRILKDQVYVGDLVAHKIETVNYRTGKKALVPKEKQIIVENTHEPLISREDFNRVQELLKARHRPAYLNPENLFKGILFCATCGKRMCLGVEQVKAVGHTRVKKSIMRCFNHTNNPQECPKANSVYYHHLKEQVWLSVKKVLILMKSDGSSMEAVRKKLAGQNNSEKLTVEKAKIEKRLITLAALTRKIYEDYVAERLDEDGYQGLLAGYQAEKKALTERTTAIAAELGKTGGRDEQLKRLKQFAMAYADSTELTAEIVKKLIERIELKPRQVINGKVIREINIIYRFINTSL